MINSKLFGLILIIFSFVLVLTMEGIATDSNVDITFLIILCLSSIGLTRRENQPYSLYRMFYLFAFFFFGIAPFLQYKNGGFSVFGSTPLNYSENFETNLIIITILILYSFFYEVFYYKRKKKNVLRPRGFFDNGFSPKFTKVQNIKILLLSLFAFLVMFYINNFSIIGLLVRGGDLIDRVEFSSSSLRLIITKVIQPMMMICLLFYIKTKNKNYFTLTILFILTLIGSSPTGMPRFAAAALYIPFALYTLPFLRKKNNFALVISFGLLILFPFLNSFRYFNLNKNLALGLDFDIFLEGSFDSYQHFATVISKGIITYGNQLLGILFFWMPRSIWENKPIGSGAFLADELGYVFPNISFNYFAEGYINFGYLGIFLFLLVFAYLTAYLDEIFWEGHYKSDFYKIAYFLLLGLTFLILRGDLLSSTAFTFGFVFSVFIVRKIVFKTTK